MNFCYNFKTRIDRKIEIVIKYVRTLMNEPSNSKYTFKLIEKQTVYNIVVKCEERTKNRKDRKLY